MLEFLIWERRRGFDLRVRMKDLIEVFVMGNPTDPPELLIYISERLF